MASNATVTVGCKLPHGLILALHNDAGQETARYTVAGANAATIIGGHGLTPAVPKDFWEEWVKRNAQSPAVRNGLIFADEQAAKTAAQANERKDTRTGFEGIDPKKPDPTGQIQPSDKKA